MLGVDELHFESSSSTDGRQSRYPANPQRDSSNQATSADEPLVNQVIYERKPNIIVCPVSRTSKPMVRVPFNPVWSKGWGKGERVEARAKLRAFFDVLSACICFIWVTFRFQGSIFR